MVDPWDKVPEPVPEPISQPVPDEKLLKQFDHTAEPEDNDKVNYGDIPESIEPGLEGQFYLSQSLIKRLTTRFGTQADYCGLNIYHLYVKRDIKQIVSEPMMEGNYGEFLILGHNAKNSDPVALKTHSKTGRKKINQERIEIQAERFKKIALIKQINIIPGLNTQVPVFKQFGNGSVILRGEIDVFPTTILWEDTLRLTMLDIKFTGDVNNTFGDFGWGNEDQLDYIQGDFYHYLIRDFDIELNALHGARFNNRVGYSNIFNDTILRMIKNNMVSFIYAVLGYKKPDLNNQFKMIERLYKEPNNGDIRQRELQTRIKLSLGILTQEHNTGWKPNPFPDICKTCALNTTFGGFCNLPHKPKQV